MRAFIVALLLAMPLSAADRLGSYIFATGERGQHVRIVDHDWPSFAGPAMRSGERFFWFKYDGRSYMIRDAATLASIDALFAPMHSLHAEHRELRAKVRPLERQMRDLERQSRRLERARQPDEAKIRDLERQIEDLEAQIEKYEPEEEELDRREEQIETEAQAKLVTLVASAIRSGVATQR